MAEPEPTSNPAILLREMRLRAGLSMDALAVALGLKGASSLQRYEDPAIWQDKAFPVDFTVRLMSVLIGKGNPRITRDDLQPLMLAWFKVVEAADYFPREPWKEPRPNVAAGPDTRGIASLPRDVPVMGNAVGGPDGYVEMNSGNPVDYVRRPPGIAANRSIYAIYVVGASMEPVYEAGDLVYVDPARPIQIGRDVVVQIKPHEPGEPLRAYVKRLVRATAAQVIVQQFNPEEELIFERRSIESLHYVMKFHEVLGI